MDARYKSRSRWWEGEIVELDDVERADEFELEQWESENLENLILC
jgi:hypothetical protein